MARHADGRPAPADQALEARAVEDALIRAARSLSACLNVDGACDAVLGAVETIFGATSSWVVLHDRHSNQLRTAAYWGPAASAYAGVAIPPDVGILGLAFTSRRVVFVPDAQQDDRWFDTARVHSAGLRSVFTVPLVHQDTVIGVVGLDSPRFSADRPPSDADVARLEALAAQAAIAIANARLYEASERDRRRLLTLLQERRRLRRQVDHLEGEIRAVYSFGEIVSVSPEFAETIRQVHLVAPGDTTVLLLGETGTGKELLARLIHERSARKAGPFVAVNCAALPEALVESELFGHEKGAFTGALARKAGKFEIAHGGAIFLDEIGDLPADAQAKVLRAFQEGEVQRVGATHPIKVDVRIIAATNQDLEAAVAEKRFRPDLYYRLSVFPIRVPALRERPDDVAPLAVHFARHLAIKLHKDITHIDDAALDKLRAYSWPGNVRELENVIERAIIVSRGPVLTAEAIGVREAEPLAEPQPAPGGVMTLADAERRAIRAALAATGWRVSGTDGAAEALGLRPTTLHSKMKKLGIERAPPSETGTS